MSKSKEQFETVGELIRYHRQKKQLTLQNVADYCGCTRAFISLIEKGRSPLPLHYTPKISFILELPENELKYLVLSTRPDFKILLELQATR